MSQYYHFLQRHQLSARHHTFAEKLLHFPDHPHPSLLDTDPHLLLSYPFPNCFHLYYFQFEADLQIEPEQSHYNSLTLPKKQPNKLPQFFSFVNLIFLKTTIYFFSITQYINRNKLNISFSLVKSSHLEFINNF